MSEPVTTIFEVFFPEEPDGVEAFSAPESASPPPTEDSPLDKARAKVAEKLTELRTSEETKEQFGKLGNAAVKLVSGKLDKVLEIDLLEGVLVKAWNKSKVFAKYLGEDYPPNETVRIPLLEHPIKSTHHPVIEIRHDDELIYSFRFEVTLTLKLDGINVEIENRHIIALYCAGAVAEGEIKLCYSSECPCRTGPPAPPPCTGIRIFDLESQRIELLGEKVFAEPIAVAG